MEINKKEQTQTAGDNSVQNQISGLQNCNVTINSVNQSEIRAIATEVCYKELLNVYRSCTQDAIKIAEQRNEKFANTFISRIEKVESAINSLKDPAFQYMIQDARETAIKTDRVEDIEMLSELLVCHIEKGKDKKINAGISRAIKIVDEIDYDALCALTVICSILRVNAVSGDIKEGLSVLDNMFESIIDIPLPTNDEWIEHLSVLGAINFRRDGKFANIKNLFLEKYNGYICIGIKKGTKEEQDAFNILRQNNISENELVDNLCMPGYVRLNVNNRNYINDKYKSMCKQIFDLYIVDNVLMEQAIQNFMKVWDSYEYLKMVKDWYESITIAFEINSIGLALVQTNGKRCFPQFPNCI